MAKTAKSRIEPETPNAELDQTVQTPPRERSSEEEIAVRAYYIYLERDGAQGNPDDDWRQAEIELNEAFDQ